MKNIADGNVVSDLKKESARLESIVLNDMQLCDFELIANGGFAPLVQFMGEADYENVVENMRLSNGKLFPIPVTLSVDRTYPIGTKVALRDAYGALLAIMTIEELYRWDKKKYAKALMGSYDKAHPHTDALEKMGKYNIAGKLDIIKLPQREDFSHLRYTPNQVRELMEGMGVKKIVAFQTRNPLHRAHEELTKAAAKKAKAALLLHPVVGLTKPGDIDYITRVRCYEALVKNHYKNHQVILSLLPLAMRMAGPREALWHAIIRKNYGATHFIVGRDHAGPGNNSKGAPFYGAYDAQALALQHEKEVGIKILTFNEMVYVENLGGYRESNKIKAPDKIKNISGTQVRDQYLAKNIPLPEWFTRPEVAKILAESNVPLVRRGFCLWFTGLSGSGKSTIARALEAKLNESGRVTTMLDGDIIRNHLSKGLGFSKEDRDENVKRIGYVASQVVKHNGVAICAAISPYREARKAVRNFFDKGRFIEIYISTPIEVCEERDPKGLYQQARQGKLRGFTGIDDAYEAPKNPEVVIDTSKLSVAESVGKILDMLEGYGFYSK